MLVDIAASDCFGVSLTNRCFRFPTSPCEVAPKRILCLQESLDTNRLETARGAPLGHLCLPRQSQNQQARLGPW